MALTEAEKRLLSQAAYDRTAQHLMGEFTNHEVRAKDEASRQRFATPSGVKTGRELLSEFGSLFNYFTPDQTRYTAFRYNVGGPENPNRIGYIPFYKRIAEYADGAEREYQDYLKNKPKHIAGWNGNYHSAGDSKGIITDLPQMTQDQNLWDSDGFYLGTKSDPEWEAGAEELRKKAELYRGLADALRQENLTENIDVYADQAEKAYQDYIHSEEYVARSQAREQERLERMAMANAMGVIPGYQALFSYTEEDQREQELRNLASYYRNLSNQKKDNALMAADLKELAGWSQEEQHLLMEYATNQLWNTADPMQVQKFSAVQMQTKPLIEKYGKRKVDELAESYRRSQNAEAAQMAANLWETQQDKQSVPADTGLAPNVVQDLKELNRWAQSEQMLLAEHAMNQVQETSDPDRAKRIAEYLNNKFGADRVQKVAESWLRNKEYEEKKAQQAEIPGNSNDMTFWEGLGHSAGSAAANLAGSFVSPLAYLVEGANRTGRYSTLDPNNIGQLPGIYADAARQKAAESIEKTGFGKAGATVYKAGMSAIDNLLRTIVGGKTGSLALAATGSFGSAMKEYSQQGVDPRKAFVMSLVRGGIEVATEKLSLDNLLGEMGKPKDLAAALSAAFKAGAIEVSEEEFGLLLSIFTEAAYLREESSFNRRVAELQAYGLSNSQAREQACYGLIEEAAETAVQSFLSGGMMSGATTVYTNAMDRQQKNIQPAERGRGSVETGGIEVAQDVLEAAHRISASTGRNIQFYESVKGDDGFYDPDTGIIHVNTRGADPVAQILSHELTHSVEGSDTYKELSSLVLKRIQMTGGNLAKLRQEKQELYSKNGKPLKDQAAVDREIVASYVAHHLLTNEAEITSLVREQPNLGRRILNWLNDLWAKLGSGKAQEKEFIRKARDLYSRALDQTQGAPTEAKTQNAPIQSAGVQQAGQAQQESPETDFEGMTLEEQKRFFAAEFRAGRITEEEFDSLMEAMQMYEEQNGIDGMAREDKRFQPKEDGRQYSFAGPKARTANLTELRRAEVMEQQGIDSEHIRRVTGWFRGLDRKWRFEIDDSNMKYHRAGDARFAEMHPEYARHQELMQKWLYGELSSQEEAEFRELDEVWGREHQRLSDRVRRGNATLQNILSHDELFAAYPELQGVKVVFGELADGTKATYNHRTQKITLNNSLRNAPESELLHEIQHAIQHIEGFTTGSTIARWQQRIEEGYDPQGRTAKDLYENTAGEIEARDAAGRRNLKAEQRKNTRPDIDRSDAEFIHSNENFAYVGDTRDGRRCYQSGFDSSVSMDQKVKLFKERIATVFNLGAVELKTDVKRIKIRGDRFTAQKNIYGDHSNQPSEQDAKIIALYDLADILATAKFVPSATSIEPSFANPANKPKNAAHKNVKYWYKFRNEIVFDGVPYTVTFNIRDKGKNQYQYLIEFKENKTPGLSNTVVKNLLRTDQASYENIIDHGVVKVNRKYSIPESRGVDAQRSSTGVQEDQSQNTSKEVTRESLNTKASNSLRSTEWDLLNKIGNALGVPYHAKRDTLKPLIQEMSDEYLKTGMISEETKARIFEAAYEAGIVIDREFYDQYKHIKDHLRTTAVTLNQRDRADIADFQEFRRRANRGKLLRIVEDGGLPVDTFYQQMQDMAHELFPDSITHPADQLQRMYDVSQSIVISESSLNAYYGSYAQEHKRNERSYFNENIADVIPRLRNVRRYGEDKLLAKEDGEPISLEEAEEIGTKLKQARRNYEKVNAKHLLTAHDEMMVGRLLRGETQLEYLEKEENFDSIKAVYEAKQEYEEYAALQTRYKRQVRKAKLELADSYLQTASSWKDKKAGILYSRETMTRNIFDIVPDKELAKRIVEEYFESVHRAEAESTKFKTEFRNRVRDLNLSRKVDKGNLVSEAHAVQLLGEAMDNIRVIENSRGRIKTRDGMNLREWQAAVQNLWAENPNLDQAKIENAVQEFRKIYDELFREMNRVRLANGYEPVSYRQGYFPHFQPGDGDGIMAYFGRILGIDVNVDALPTTINGLTHTFKPGIQWFGNAQERLGFNTAYDAVEGFDKYIEGVSSVIHHTENIQKLRALATQARYRTSDQGLRDRVDAIQQDTRLTDEERQMKIRDIYENGRFELANFVAELDEYTNLLANKKSKYDRNMEHMMGRKWYTIMKRVESQVGANMIAGNLSSAFTNFIPLTQAVGRIGVADMARGIRDTSLAVLHKDKSIVGQSDFLTNRRGSDVLVKNWQDKLSDTLGTPMELIDNIVSESIVRAAYHQNLRRGLSEAEAIHQADVMASSIMADRSKGAMPTLFEASNPIVKLFTQFQLEVNNQYSELFKDIPREYAGKAKFGLALALMKYFIAAWLWNEFEEWMKGRRSALDPIDTISNFISDWKNVGIGDAVSNLSVDLLENLPFSSALNLVGFELDGGRIPVSSAIPDFSAAWNALTGKDLTAKQRVKALGTELQKPITYLLMPAGGNQLAKSWKAIDAFLKGGSYSMNQDGEDILQYPIYKDTPGEQAGNFVKAMLFGKSSLSTAQDWVANDFDSLDAKETAVYQDLLDSGTAARDAYEALKRVQAVPKENPKLVENAADIRRQNQTNILLNDDSLSDDARIILFYGLVATESEREMMNQLSDVGMGNESMVKFVSEFFGIKYRSENKKQDYRDLLTSSGLTEDEKTVAVEAFLGSEETTEAGRLTLYGKFKMAVNDGLSVDKFMDIYAADADAGSSMDKYFKFNDRGISAEYAADLVIEMAALKPPAGKKSVTWDQQCDVILESRLSAADQVKALEEVSYASTGSKIRIGHENGLPPGALVYLKRILPDFDENGNGSYTYKEVAAAIDAVTGDDNLIYVLTGTTPHGFRLTDEQKAVLWQLQTGAKDGKGNPYSREIGKMIYDLVQTDKDARGNN